MFPFIVSLQFLSLCGFLKYEKAMFLLIADQKNRVNS